MMRNRSIAPSLASAKTSRASIALCVATALVLSLCGSSCGSHSNGPGGAGGDNTDDGRKDRAEYQVEDRGHFALVNRYLDAIVAGNAIEAAACLSPWARNEIEVQFRKTGEEQGVGPFEAYVNTTKAVLANYTQRKRPDGINSPYRRKDDRGEFLELLLVRPNPLRMRTIAFYIESNERANSLVIDNILTPDPLELATSVPAFNPSIPSPGHAWLVYYTSVFHGRHPYHTPLETDPLLTMPQRLTYLRAVSSPDFLQSIVGHRSFGGNVASFIQDGEKQFKESYGAPTLFEGSDPSEFFVTFVHKRTSVELSHKLKTIRIHGQTRLHRHDEVDLDRAAGR